MRHYENVTVGHTETFGSYEVSREEMLTFAEQYDPQWFHTDPERASAESPYGGVIASGWQTASLTMRLLVDNVLSEAATVGAKGVDRLRWPAPVRPGDTLACRYEVLEKEPEHPGRGLVRAETETYRVGDGEAADGDDDGELVFRMEGLVMYRRREGRE
ncbi:MaoC/PaaZ C-terminal domain-containing protein [Halobaculum sp. MBLA0143]|uniref:MaoC/PaaZ C-terminal domain-containing protein n=1 Tax=Halobaculum sp. MBLA0143 TaxID=3079933 RepID=UPI003524B652